MTIPMGLRPVICSTGDFMAYKVCEHGMHVMIGDACIDS